MARSEYDPMKRLIIGIFIITFLGSGFVWAADRYESGFADTKTLNQSTESDENIHLDDDVNTHNGHCSHASAHLLGLGVLQFQVFPIILASYKSSVFQSLISFVHPPLIKPPRA